MSKLTSKQQLFIKEYLIDLNGTQAAIRAGYSKKTARQIATEMLSKLYMQEAIEEAKKKRMEKADITAEYVLNSLKTVAERCMQAEEVMAFNYATRELEATGEYKFDSNGANKALELLGKHLSLFTDKLKSEVSITKSPVDELIRSIEELKHQE